MKPAILAFLMFITNTLNKRSCIPTRAHVYANLHCTLKCSIGSGFVAPSAYSGNENTHYSTTTIHIGAYRQQHPTTRRERVGMRDNASCRTRGREIFLFFLHFALKQCRSIAVTQRRTAGNSRRLLSAAWRRDGWGRGMWWERKGRVDCACKGKEAIGWFYIDGWLLQSNYSNGHPCPFSCPSVCCAARSCILQVIVEDRVWTMQIYA